MARAARAGSRVDAALLVACALFALLAIVLPSATRQAIAGALQRTVAAPFLGLQQRSERTRAAFVERERVAFRVDSLSLLVTESSQLQAENLRLRGLLALGSQLRRGFVPAQALHGQGIGNSHTLLLTVGSSAGVVVRSPLVAPGGIVGLVTTVARTTSHAITWSHPDFRVSAMSSDGETFGIVTPHLAGDEVCADGESAACASPERFLLELHGVAFRDALKPGTLIMSSGLGGVFPRGIAIGKVVAELKTTEQWSRTYLVQPTVRPQDVSDVMVLSPALVAENLSAVWERVGAGQSVVGSVIAAGDSLARQAADSLQRLVADSVARKALADSAAQQALTDAAARRDTIRSPR